MRDFWFTPSYTLWVTPQFFFQIKHLMEVHNHGKFHWCSICGCQVINFQMFSSQCSNHEMVPFWGVSGPFLLQIWLKFLKISTRGTSFVRKKQSLNNLSKLSVSAETGLTQNWWFWSIFGTNLPSKKPKYCKKSIFFQKLHPYDYQITQVPGSREITEFL